MSSEHWNPQRYQAGHSYVWRYGEALIELLEPRPGERILDLGPSPKKPKFATDYRRLRMIAMKT